MNGHDFTLEQNTEARMMLAVARRGLDLAGQWSLDIMRDGDDYWLIDMAPAERSTFYEQAVPKGKRRPMMENWIPELGGKH